MAEVYIPDKRHKIKILIYVIKSSSASYPLGGGGGVVKVASCADPEIVFPRGIFLIIWWLDEDSSVFGKFAMPLGANMYSEGNQSARTSDRSKTTRILFNFPGDVPL